MDKELFTSLEEHFKSGELFAATALVVAIVYSIWRTGSVHLIRRRLWAILYGKDEISNEEIRAFVADRSSLMAFRFNTGVPARTLEHAKRMVAWASENDEDLHCVAVTGDYFDREAMRLKEHLPRMGWRLALTYVAGCLGVFIFVAAAPSWTARGYFQLRASGLWFSSKGTDVREAGPSIFRASSPWIGMPSDRQPLTIEMCKSGNFPADVFGRDQATLLCQFLNAPDKDKLIADDLRVQRRGGGVLLALFLSYFGMAVWSLVRLQAAWRMKKRLIDRPKQMPLPFESE